MMMLTTHGLFLTCTQKFYLYIYITCNYFLGTTPFHQNKKGKTPLNWKADVLLMLANPHLLWSLAWYQLPSPYFPIRLTPSHPLGPYYITMTTSTISVFLVQNKNHQRFFSSLCSFQPYPLWPNSSWCDNPFKSSSFNTPVDFHKSVALREGVVPVQCQDGSYKTFTFPM
jgi:hypothetical protein